MRGERKTHRGISIGWKLALYLLFFLTIVLLVVGIFQILLLDFFFKDSKQKELRQTASEIALHLSNEEQLEYYATSYAADRAMEIAIYKLSSNNVQSVISLNMGGGARPESLEPQKLAELYAKAEENGGSYETQLAFGDFEVPPNDWEFFPFDGEKREPVTVPKKNIRLTYVLLAENEAGEKHLLLLNTALLPLDSTVKTLKLQFIWITVILVTLTVLITLFLYRKISKPLIRMNAEAKKLALGQYNVTFSGKGYKETRELADTLNYASRELARSDQLQKELIANVSHDLRTPLTMIRGYGEMMRDIPNENTPENMQLILDETARLSALVNDLLDLSKIQSGSSELTPTVFDLTEALRELMARYEAFTKHLGYQIQWEAEGCVPVCADRNMILQVLYNLINNAINYTGESKTITVRQAVNGQAVRISITDTGDGIPQDQVTLIWERYYKVDKFHKRAAVGSGLGLSIVKEILERHGAAYGVTSTLHVGSTFWFELPICKQDPSAPPVKKEGEGH